MPQSGESGLHTYAAFPFFAIGTNLVSIPIAVWHLSRRPASDRWSELRALPWHGHALFLICGALLHSGTMCRRVSFFFLSLFFPICLEYGQGEAVDFHTDVLRVRLCVFMGGGLFDLLPA